MPSPLEEPYRLEYVYKRTTGPVTGAFLAGLRSGVLLGSRARDGRVLFPASEVDHRGGATVGLTPVGPGAVVVTAVEARGGHPAFGAAWWALIRPDGADTSMLHLVGAPVRAGDRVHPVWAATPAGSIFDLVWMPGEAQASAATWSGDVVTTVRTPVGLDYVARAGVAASTFFRALAERRVLGERCAACGKVSAPMRGGCATCPDAAVTTVELAHTGVLTMFTVVRFPFEGQRLAPPYVAGWILLDGSDVPLFHLVGGADPDTIEVGARVRAVWADAPVASLEAIQHFTPVSP